jgi:hypothetical protein
MLLSLLHHASMAADCTFRLQLQSPGTPGGDQYHIPATVVYLLFDTTLGYWSSREGLPFWEVLLT